MTAETVVSSVWFTILGRAAAIIAVPLLTAGLFILQWMATTVVALQADQKVFGVQMAELLTNRYGSQDARRDLALRDLKIDAIQTRLSDLEHEIRANKIDLKTQQLETAPRRR